MSLYKKKQFDPSEVWTYQHSNWSDVSLWVSMHIGDGEKGSGETPPMERAPTYLAKFQRSLRRLHQCFYTKHWWRRLNERWNICLYNIFYKYTHENSENIILLLFIYLSS